MRNLTPNQFLSQIRTLRNRYDAGLFRAKIEIAEYALSYFKSSFDKGGFAGGRGTWKSREKDYPWPTLNKTGALRESLRVINVGSVIKIGTTNEYSQYHNDPTGTWRRNQYSGKPATQRQFIGNSKSLETWIRMKLLRTLKSIFNERTI